MLCLPTEFINLPASVSVLENVRPRIVLAQFQVQSSSSLPVIHILSVTLQEDLFESPILNPTNVSDIFNVRVQ